MRPERTSGEGRKGSAHSASAAIIRAALARRVRVLRVTKGWSQETLAEISGLHRTYVSAIERGRCNLSLESMTKLADAFGVGVAELLDAAAGIEVGGFPPSRGQKSLRE